MDQNGVATAIGSMTSPGIWFGDNEEGRRNARDCNEYGAKLAQDYPGRFGMWGAIPLPDTDGSLREIEYLYDTLKLDGIGLLTSYDDGKLLGHPNFAPVLEELNRRKAVVFVHPTISCCAMPIRHLNRVQIDFPTDTTRTITDLIYGSLIRFPTFAGFFSWRRNDPDADAAAGGCRADAGRTCGNDLNGFEHELQNFITISPALRSADSHGRRPQENSQGSSFVWIGHSIFYD
jgi:hypothetical protein